MKKIMLMLLAVSFGTSMFAQTGEIKGTLIDSISNKPVPFANVYVKYGETVIGDETDLDGKFTIKPLKPGSYTVLASSIGYQTKGVSGIQVNADKISFTGKIFISESVTIGPPIVLEIPLINLIDPENPGKETLIMTDMKNSPVRQDIGQMIALTSPKVTTGTNGELYFAGSRSGSSLYYVDGIKSNKQIKIPTSGLRSITVYTGGVPAKYGDCTGGIVVMETKSYFELYNEWKATQ